MTKFKLLTVGNPKIEKGTKFGYLTAVLHLAPGSLSGFNVCPKATTGCLAACLNTAGRGGMMKGHSRLTADMVARGVRNTIQIARIRRTRWYFEDRAGFMAALAADIAKVERLAVAHGLKPAIRLNGTSDIPWERVPVTLFDRFKTVPNVMALFPRVQFYDYTKRSNRTGLPSNYTLTFSLAEGNDNDAWTALANGMNVAAVFHKVPAVFVMRREVPALASSRPVPVIDGDEHDLRFLDPRGVVVGLKAKGNAKRDRSGFVR
jgi:hypothetical protein